MRAGKSRVKVVQLYTSTYPRALYTFGAFVAFVTDREPGST